MPSLPNLARRAIGFGPCSPSRPTARMATARPWTPRGTCSSQGPSTAQSRSAPTSWMIFRASPHFISPSWIAMATSCGPPNRPCRATTCPWGSRTRRRTARAGSTSAAFSRIAWPWAACTSRPGATSGRGSWRGWMATGAGYGRRLSRAVPTWPSPTTAASTLWALSTARSISAAPF